MMDISFESNFCNNAVNPGPKVIRLRMKDEYEKNPLTTMYIYLV